MSSHKIILNEFCQKYYKQAPTYEFEITNSGWIAYVILPNRDKYKGTPAINKNLASNSAAQIAYIDIKDSINQSKYDIDKGSIVLVDLDNSKFEGVQDVQIYGFLSKFSSIKIEHLPYEIKIIDSAVKDATDIYLTYWSGKLSMIYKDKDKPKIYLISRDHFIKTVQQCLEDDGFTVIHLI